MQHYRTPTRLLDWTENVLVALYFAVSMNHEEDGEIWAILPWALNEAAGAGWSIPMITMSSHVRYFIDEPYWKGSKEKLADKLNLDGPIKCPIAVEPPFFFPHMAVQAGTFTIHPYPENSKSIVEALPDSKHLVRYIIPAIKKEDFVEELRVLGFSDRHLFPDLEGLSRMIVYDNRKMAYSPPNPPECSGEVTNS